MSHTNRWPGFLAAFVHAAHVHAANDVAGASLFSVIADDTLVMVVLGTNLPADNAAPFLRLAFQYCTPSLTGRFGICCFQPVMRSDIVASETEIAIKELLGGKGANLAEMTRVGLPVPPGFPITTEVCDLYYRSGRKLPERLMDEVRGSVAELEAELNKTFGGTGSPLLVSVRSGAARSMPGMMNTILNLGLNDEVVVGLGNAISHSKLSNTASRQAKDIYYFGKTRSCHLVFFRVPVLSADSRQRRAHWLIERYLLPSTSFHQHGGQSARFDTTNTS